MKKFVCNPMNLSYRYQYFQQMWIEKDGKIVGRGAGKEFAVREAADPTLINFKGRYYLFPSMSKGFWVSDDLAEWEYVKLKNTPPNAYAPDVCVVGEYMYFCASARGEVCPFYRTRDPLSGEFEKIEGTFEFWDPHMFRDDDGRLYFYWGCTNTDPIFGVELNPHDMTRKGEVQSLIYGKPDEHGFERIGDDHKSELPEGATELEKRMRAVSGTAPFIEGAYMTKRGGKYYLQYAAPATENNVYADGVYVSDSPLSGFRYAENNPYSYKPGGFITGAGHGSTLEDKYGNLWHVSTMRISRGHQFERRVGLFPAGFDEDGELFCNQRYGDFPFAIQDKRTDPWAEPEMFLLSYGKKVRASSYADGNPPENAVNENIRDWWKAQASDKEQWLEVDLGQVYRVKAVQINFADDNVNASLPKGKERIPARIEARFIDDGDQGLKTRWLLEGSKDGKEYFVLCDKRNADTDLPHDFIAADADIRYVRLTVTELPFGQEATLSGLRVFGTGTGAKPQAAEIVGAERSNGLEAEIAWKGNAVGYTVLWGHSPEKLYHSYTVYGKTHLKIGALNKGQKTFVRVDSFNENGITHGKVCEIL